MRIGRLEKYMGRSVKIVAWSVHLLRRVIYGVFTMTGEQHDEARKSRSQHVTALCSGVKHILCRRDANTTRNDPKQSNPRTARKENTAVNDIQGHTHKHTRKEGQRLLSVSWTKPSPILECASDIDVKLSSKNAGGAGKLPGCNSPNRAAIGKHFETERKRGDGRQERQSTVHH